MKSYDDLILDHYRKVAQLAGLSSESTMADRRTRHLETNLLSDFFFKAIQYFKSRGREPETLVVADYGCGNGYTLDILSKIDSSPSFVGYEYSPDLRAIAQQRFNHGPVQVRPVDIRRSDTIGPELVDISITQRVIINLLDEPDQVLATDNMVRAGSPVGLFIFIECFQSGLDNLNAARAEFGLSPISRTHHNLYLRDDFFDDFDLIDCCELLSIDCSNFLSTHYYVSRVLHPLVLGDRPFHRNSHFVDFMSNALAPNIGDFSPIQAKIMHKAK